MTSFEDTRTAGAAASLEDRSAAAPRLVDRLSARLVFSALAGVHGGEVALTLPDGSVRRFGAGGRPVRVHVARWRAFARLLRGGDCGAAESYMDGDWSADDLVNVVALFIANAARFDRDTPLTRFTNWGNRMLHAARRNTHTGSRRNIRAHYDLGNAFYELFLDSGMTYSCALFGKAGETLEEAQENKLRRVAELARLGPGMNVLEIGCGWGSFAVFAAKTFGCRVTGLTLSVEQAVFARERARTEGVEDLVEIRLEDYRVTAARAIRYERIVSIEMLEAVGHEYLGTFFGACDRLLEPGGLAVIQSITIPDQRHDRLLGRPDFIKKHIFPGSHVPSVTSLVQALTRHSSLVVDHLEGIGPHYVETLRRWRTRFLANRAAVRALGFDERFLRMWEYYLSYCEGGFLMRYVNDVHMVLKRP